MSLLKMSLSGAVLILVVTVIRAVAIHKLPKKTFLVLWELVLLRLLIPFSIPSKLSVYTQFSRRVSNPAGLGIEADKLIPAAMQQEHNFTMQGIGQLTTNSMASVPVWFVVWCAGMILCAFVIALAYLRCLAAFQTALPVRNDYIERWLKECPLKRCVVVKKFDRISAPLTYGVIRPVILMPKNTDWNDISQLRYILTHEYVHISRYDTVTKLMMALVLCIHWFNPMVWVMYLLFTRDLELACDESVIRKFGEASKAAYARMLIGVETKKSGLSPFCNNFSKNAIEERIVAIMKIKKTSVAAIAVAAILIVGAATAFATSAENGGDEKSSVSLAGYTEEETAKLLALQFDGYEDMRVSEYQNKVWELTDTPEYRNLLENFSQDTALYEQRDKNETASFLFYTLEPLTAEKWQTRDFGGSVTTDFPSVADNAVLEFIISLTIEDADVLTVREYNATRVGISNGLQGILRGKTKEQLRNDAVMQQAIHTEIENLTEQWNIDGLRFSVEYFYSPLSEPDTESSGQEGMGEEREVRPYPNATEEDYRTLLALKTADYQNRPVADFNMDLLEWANESYERMERIGCDTAYHDFAVALDDTELAFVTLSVQFSGLENAKYVQSNYTGREEEEPSIGQYLPEKSAMGATNRGNAWCDLYYQFSWRIADKETITVGERDRCICNMTEGIQTFWNETDFEQMIKMSKEDIVSRLQEIAAACSNDKIVLTIGGESVSFEKMDERGIEFN